MLTLAIATGLILWVVKRRERAPLLLANRILERLNAGVLAGVPLGCVAYLLANRLLPLGMPDRAASEVSVALATTAAALAAGLALPAGLAWPLLLALLAIGCAIAPWFVPLGDGDPAILAGNLMLLVVAAAFMPLIRRQLRRRAAPAQRRAGRATA